LVTLPLVLPPTVTGYYLIVLLGRRGWLGAPLYAATGWTIAFTWYAAVVAATVMALPLLVRTARAAIESVDRDLEKAAYTLGRSEWRTTLEVTLPLARNGILAGLVLAFARALGEFGATLMLAGNIPGKTATVPLAIYTAVQTGEQSTVLVLVAILTALSCVVLVAAGRLGPARPAGRAARREDRGGARAPRARRAREAAAARALRRPAAARGPRPRARHRSRPPPARRAALRAGRAAAPRAAGRAARNPERVAHGGRPGDPRLHR